MVLIKIFAETKTTRSVENTVLYVYCWLVLDIMISYV